MILLELIDWALDNPGDLTIIGVLLMVLRKVVLSEFERVIQMGRDEELIWTRERVEELTGSRWSGPRPLSQRVKIQYTVSYYKYLLGGIPLGSLRGRIKQMQLNRVWLAHVVTYILGVIAVKRGVTFHDETANMIVDLIITVYPLVLAWINKTKVKPAPVVTEDKKPEGYDNPSAINNSF